MVDAPARVVNNTFTMNENLGDKKLAVLGTGKLGGILLRAYLKQGLFKPQNRTAVRGADIVLLGVKPQIIGDVLQEISGELSPSALVVSVAASVPTSYIEQRLGAKAAVVGVMPNTCSTG